MAWSWAAPEPWLGWDSSPGAVTHALAQGQHPPNPVPAGSVVQFPAAAYGVSGRTLTANGTAEAPVFVIAEPGATFVDNAQWTIAGSYVYLVGLTMLGGARLQITGDHVAVRGCEITGLPVSGSSRVMVSPGAGSHHVVVSGCHIHHNGAQPADVHAVKTSAPGYQYLWVVDCELDHNGGDGVQIGSATLAEPWPEFVYVLGNEMHENGENGYDGKKSRNVIVEDNLIWGMTATPGNDPGRGIVIHDAADATNVRWNVVRDCAGEGVVSTGATGLLFMENDVIRCGYGVRAYSSSGEAFGNRAWDCAVPFQFNVPSGTVNAHDNLIDPPEGEPPTPITGVQILVEA